jgi:hypothetical protein
MRGLWILTVMLAACHPVAATAEKRDALEADKNWEAVYGGMSEIDKITGVVLEPAGAEK